MIKGVLLDFDGTVVDSEVSRYESSKIVLQEYGFDLTQELWESVFKAVSSKELFEYVIEELNLKSSYEELYTKAKEIRTQIETQKGIELILGFLEFYAQCEELDLKCIICSGGTTEHVLRILNQCNLDIKGFGRERYKNRKPFPDAWIAGLEELGLQQDEVVLFDDASSGIEAGLRAGIEKCCAINYDKKDFENIERIEEKVGSTVFRYFSSWKDVDMKEIVEE